MLSIEEIKQFIDEDLSSEKKRLARIGNDYYEGKHEIKNYRLFYFDEDGQLQEDNTRSNTQISHPFFTELVDQAAQYMLSGDNYIFKSDLPELQNKLDEYFNENENFMAELLEVITGTKSKGFEYMYAYKDENDKLAFECADSMGVVEVRAKDTQDNCDYVIYWYIDRIEKGQKRIKRIQVWDKNQTHYYVDDGDGNIEKDESVEINPRPHTIYNLNGKRYFENFGFIPFFRLDNNKKQFSDLTPIKDLIDDYDLMNCGLSNNIQDANEYLVVVTGFKGNDLSELMQNIKTKKRIGVGEGGDVNFKTVDIPYQARQTKMSLDEVNIYRFGMGFNSAQLGDGNITNVVIKSRYALLDLKCNKLEIRLKQFLRKILKIVLEEINNNNGTDYQQKDVYFDFKREVITNEADNASIAKIKADTKMVEINTLLNLKGALDDETIIQNICEVLDIDFEEIKSKLPTPAEEEINAAMAALTDNATLPTDTIPSGDA